MERATLFSYLGILVSIISVACGIVILGTENTRTVDIASGLVILFSGLATSLFGAIRISVSPKALELKNRQE